MIATRLQWLTFQLLCCVLVLSSLTGCFRHSRGIRVKTCLECHAEKAEELSQPVVHTPFGSRECEACHERHGLANMLMLKNSSNDLCFECHEQLKKVTESASVHPAFTQDKCWSCHDPHSSMRAKLLKATVPKGLCKRSPKSKVRGVAVR